MMLSLTYTGGEVEPKNNEHLVVKDTGKTITVTPDTFMMLRQLQPIR